METVVRDPFDVSNYIQSNSGPNPLSYKQKALMIEVKDIRKEKSNELEGKYVWIEARLNRAYPYLTDSVKRAAFVIEDNSPFRTDGINKRIVVEAYGEDSFYLALVSVGGDIISAAGYIDMKPAIPKIKADLLTSERAKF